MRVWTRDNWSGHGLEKTEAQKYQRKQALAGFGRCLQANVVELPQLAQRQLPQYAARGAMQAHYSTEPDYHDRRHRLGDDPLLPIPPNLRQGVGFATDRNRRLANWHQNRIAGDYQKNGSTSKPVRT